MDLGVDPSPSRVGAASPGSSCRSPTWRGRAGIVLLESEDCARRRGHIGSLDIRVRRSSLTGITPRQADLSRRRGGVARAEVAGGRVEVAGPGPATCAVDSRGVEKRPLGRRLLSSASGPATPPTTQALFGFPIITITNDFREKNLTCMKY